MKITILNTYDNGGGAAIAAVRLAEALKGINAEVHILCLESKTDHEYTTEISSLPWKKWPFYLEKLCSLPFEKDSSFRFLFSTAQFGYDVSKHPLVIEADIIHLHWWNQGLLSLDNLHKLKELNKPIVWTFHDKWVMTGGCHITKSCTKYQTVCEKCPYLINRLGIDVARNVFDKKNNIYNSLKPTFISCSNFHLNLAKSSTLLSKHDIHHIPNPIDTDFFKPKMAVSLDKMNPNQEITILFVAAEINASHKGLTILIESLRILNNKNINLAIVGQDKQGTIDSLELKHTYYGSVAEPANIIEIYNSVDVLVAPSLEDNLPNTILEGISCGLPIIAFDTGGISELVESQNGYLIRDKNAQALGSALDKFVNNKHNWKSMSTASRNIAIEKYSYHYVGLKFMTLYQSLIGTNE